MTKEVLKYSDKIAITIYKMGGKKLANVTPHDLHLVDAAGQLFTLPPSGFVLSVPFKRELINKTLLDNYLRLYVDKDKVASNKAVLAFLAKEGVITIGSMLSVLFYKEYVVSGVPEIERRMSRKTKKILLNAFVKRIDI